MYPDIKKPNTEQMFSSPESTVALFYNALFGHTRNWPRAYSCLAPQARRQFEAAKGLTAFADYWDEQLSFLEECVRHRHRQYHYTHRTCFSTDKPRVVDIAGNTAIVSVEILENHIASEQLVIVQSKELVRNDQSWLLTNGELEGNLDGIIEIRGPRRAKKSGSQPDG
jgi:hypothetical protein